MTKVLMIESEYGWGQRIDEVLEFPTHREADEFAASYNQKHNNQSEAPNWYIKAVVYTTHERAPMRRASL